MAEYAKKWTWEELRIVSQLALKGWSAANIAKELVGRTRNSVIGVCGRQGIKLLAKPVKDPQIAFNAAPNPKRSRSLKRTSEVIPRVVKVVTPPPVYEVQENFEPLNKTIMDLQYGYCRAVTGPIKNAETFYCGHPVIAGKSWCPHHFSIYTTPAKTRLVA